MKNVYRFCFDFAKNKKDLDFLVARGKSYNNNKDYGKLC